MSERQKFTTRDWWFVIALLVLVQFVIHWLSFQFSGSQNALGYVSFAGTLVSIMLGLIAIIYSFVQSISQSSSVIEIREQVDKLIVAGREIAESGRTIHSASQEVNGLVEDLASKVTENTSTSKQVLGSFGVITSHLNRSSELDGRLVASQADNVKSHVDVIEGGASEKSLSLLQSTRIITRIMLLAVYEGKKRGYSVDDIEERLLGKIAKHLEVNRDYLAGAFTATLLALEAEGHVTLPDDDIDNVMLPLSEFFLSSVKNFIPETMNGDTKQFTSYWLAINEDEAGESE